ncbi:MAG: molybdopterin-dependent oxidoreductase [Pyrinomonadaceae bacterium]|nr:molybdopterin-dependent oxidoreductase [Pyrinomonadaceae bacterium]
MKTFFITLLFLTFATFANAQKALEKSILRVEVANESISKSVEFKMSDLAKLTRRDLKIKSVDNKETTFSGFELREVLQLAGVKFGDDLRGKRLAEYLLVEAADGYKAVFALTELDAAFTDKIILLADKRDGKPLGNDEGVLRIVVSDEKKQARSVRQVVALKIKKAQ